MRAENVAMSFIRTTTRGITDEDIDICARLTGDIGSHHMDGLAGRRMAQGVLTLSSLPLLGSPGVHMRELSFAFLAPVYVGDTINTTVEVTKSKDLPGGLIEMSCEISVVNGAGKQVITGSGVAELPREQAAELTASAEGGI